jgi:hypothetical protein
LVGRVAVGQAFWRGGGRKVWVRRVKAERRSIIRWLMGEGGLWVECHTEEFCVKVLKFEICSDVVLRTIEI